MKTIRLLFLIGVLLNSNNLFSQEETVTKPKETSRYYYFPNLQSYFDNVKMVYYYKENNEWQTAPELPINYGGYSLYNKVRVVIKDYDGENPQQFLNAHKKLYPYNAKGRFTNATASSD